MAEPTNNALFLFDGDDTLYFSYSVHKKAYKQMFEEVYGVDAKLDEVKGSGQTAFWVIENILTQRKVSYEIIADRIQDAILNMGLALQAYYEDPSKAILAPGIRELLTNLTQEPHNVTGHYTGNPIQIGQILLRAHGLDSLIPVRAYAEDFGETRTDIINKAIRQAEKKYGTFARIYVIGDSVADIVSGKEAGAITVAVATGVHSVSVLGAHSPDLLYQDLGKTHDVLADLRSFQ